MKPFPNLPRKIIAFDTVIPVTVLDVVKGTGQVTLICADEREGKKEGYVCMYAEHEAASNAKQGDHGTLTFRPGGIENGYWDYAPNVR